MNPKILIIVLVITVIFGSSGCDATNKNSSTEEVIMKREVISKDPNIVMLKFYIADNKIAWRKYNLDSAGHFKKMKQFVLNNNVKALNAMAVQQPKITLMEAEGKIPDGRVREYGPSGKLAGEHTYRDNKRNGDFKMYYPHGPLLQEGHFVNDELKAVKQYFENGTLRLEAYYQEGGQVQSAKYFDESGNLVYQE